MTAQPKIFVGVLAYGGKVSVSQIEMWLALATTAAATRRLVHVHAVDVCGVDLARNHLTLEALEAHADWLVMIDSDVAVSGEPGTSAIFDLVDLGVRREAAVIAAPTPLRGAGGETVLNVYTYEDWERRIAVPVAPPVGTAQVEAIGGALMAVNLGWLREHWMRPPWFQITYLPGPPTLNPHGEDLGFCDGVRERGGHVLCAGGIRPSHAGR
jgi:hypothetical protein